MRPSDAADPAGDNVLEAQGITVRFGGLTAIDKLDLRLEAGRVQGLIGPNGAGKTTLINVLTGFQTPMSGAISLGGRDITRASPEHRARLGIVRTFQNVRLFADFTVYENLMSYSLGVGHRHAQATRLSLAALDFMALRPSAEVFAKTLPYGIERRVGIARALATKPRFLLLDEPAAGLNDHECDELMHTIHAIPKRFGCGVLLIEHNMRVVMNTCERVSVIDFGRKIAEDSPLNIRRDEAVLAAYLGSEVT